MKYYQIKITKKKTQPLVWVRALIPSGITFSALSVIIDDIFGIDENDFTFSVYLTLDLFEAEKADELKPRNTCCDAQEARSTFIDDYQSVYPRMSYTSGDAAFSLDMEKSVDADDPTCPIALKSSIGNIDGLNDMLRSRYLLTVGKPDFSRKIEIKNHLSTSNVFVYSKKPKSASDNLVRSVRSTIGNMADLLNLFLAGGVNTKRK